MSRLREIMAGHHERVPKTEYLTKQVIATFCNEGESPCRGNAEEVNRLWSRLAAYGKKDPTKGLHTSEMKWHATDNDSNYVPTGEWLKFSAPTWAKQAAGSSTARDDL